VTSAARFIAVVVGVAGIVMGVAAMVREAILAAEPGITWATPGWWTTVTGGAPPATTIAAIVTGCVGAVLVVLAVLQVRSGSSRRRVLDFGGEKGQSRLDVHALERALQKSVRAGLEGAQACRVTLTREPGGWFVRLEAELPARDLLGAQERATRLLRGDLERLGGVRLEGVDVVVTRVGGLARKPVAAAGQKGVGGTRSS
jgi:hypothetical protein